MPETSITLRQLFSLPDADNNGRSSEGWETFRNSLTNELPSIKWPAAMPDLAAKIGELFDVAIPDVLLASWKKADDLRTLLAESEKSPDEVFYLELAEHTVTSEHHPYVEARIKNVLVKKIEFTVRLLFNLKGFILKIQRGNILELKTGSCEVEGTVEYEGLKVAEKGLEPIFLPGSIPVLRRA